MKYFILLFFLVKGTLGFCQDPRLLDNTWILTQLVVDNNEINDPTYSSSPMFSDVSPIRLSFSDENLLTGVCNGFICPRLHNDIDRKLELGFCSSTLVSCFNPDDDALEVIYYNFLNESDLLYDISENNGKLTLTLTKTNGDTATYTNRVLSATSETVSIAVVDVYPSPFTTTLSLTFETIPNGDTLDIYDVTGKLQLSKTLKGLKKQSINVESLSHGVYFMVLKDSKTGVIVQQKKLIK